MYSRMVLMIVCWHYRMYSGAHGCVSTVVNVDWTKWIYFYVNDFEVGVNDSIFSGIMNWKRCTTTMKLKQAQVKFIQAEPATSYNSLLVGLVFFDTPIYVKSVKQMPGNISKRRVAGRIISSWVSEARASFATSEQRPHSKTRQRLQYNF